MKEGRHSQRLAGRPGRTGGTLGHDCQRRPLTRDAIAQARAAYATTEIG